MLVIPASRSAVITARFTEYGYTDGAALARLAAEAIQDMATAANKSADRVVTTLCAVEILAFARTDGQLPGEARVSNSR